MGLCKCPKRKTTSHFCFHHCVNVCEHCIVNNHTTCVVKSYTTWLKEASGSSSSSQVSASASCAVCQKLFGHSPKEVESLSTSFYESGSSTKTAIRLLCYHVIHAHCLSVYTKKLLKEGKHLNCPSCARSLWLQNDSNGTTEVDSNELSPVALQLYKYLHDKWWGQALITNRNIENIDKHLFEEDSEDAETQLFVDQSMSESKPLVNFSSSHNSIQTSDHQTQLTNGYDSPELVHCVPNTTTINHRSNSHQTFQRNFNNNYGRDLFIPQQQQECLSINMSAASNSDLSNRHTTATAPLLSNNNSNLNIDEKQDPSEKYKPKKFYNQSWSLSFRRLFQYFTGSNTEEYSTKKVAIIVILCMCIIVILLVAITSYTRSINEPFDTNNIDYGGGDEDGHNNAAAAAHIKSYDINNL